LEGRRRTSAGDPIRGRRTRSRWRSASEAAFDGTL